MIVDEADLTHCPEHVGLELLPDISSIFTGVSVSLEDCPCCVFHFVIDWLPEVMVSDTSASVGTCLLAVDL